MYLDELKLPDPYRQDFKNIIETYNENFKNLREFLLTIGDTFINESFTGSTSRRIELANRYDPTRNNLVVYCNGSIQWINKDYRATSDTSIELSFDRLETDRVDVVIIKSNLLQQDITEYVEALKALVAKSENSINLANSLNNKLIKMNEDISNKLEEFLASRYAIEDMLVDANQYLSQINAIYQNAIILKDTVTSKADEADLSAKAAKGYLEDAKAVRDAIERLSSISPSEVSDREVVDARGGYAVLGDRLSHYSYTFETADDMIGDPHLAAGSIVFIMGEHEVNDGKAGVFRVVELENTDSIVTERYYELSVSASDPNKTMYAYQIGGFGTGSGTGGSSTDGITFQVEGLSDTMYLEVGSSLTLRYLFKSGIKSGTLYYSVDGYSYNSTPISGPGYHTIELGPFKTQSSFNLRMYAIDSDGNMSDSVSSNIKIGDLSATIITTSSSYTDEDEISIRWRVSDIYGKPIVTHMKVIKNGELLQSYDIDSTTGINSKALGQLNAGHYVIQLQLDNGETTSRVYTYAYDVSSSHEISTYIVNDKTEYLDTEDILIQFGLLFDGTGKFTTECYLDNQLAASLSTNIGTNNTWNLSGTDAGSHSLRLVTKDLANRYISTINATIVIQETIKSEIAVTSDGLLINLDSRFKNNSDYENRDHWGDKCQLNQFDFISNGWISTNVDSDKTQTTVLRCNGQDTYARLDFCPFYPIDLDLTTGMTFEIKFKAYDLGDDEATVVECLDNANKGFRITNHEVRFNPFGSISGSDALSMRLDSNVWHKISLIVTKGITSSDPLDYGYYTDNDLALLYVDGFLSGIIYGSIDSNYSTKSRFATYIGAHFDQNMNYPKHFSKCEVQHLRYYANNLQHTEILNNFIADIHDKDLQATYQHLNDYKTGIPGTADSLSLPTLFIKGGDLQVLDDIEGPSSKDWIYPNVDISLTDPTGEFNAFESFGDTLKVQGTSSTNYLVKNYKITIFDYLEHQLTSQIVKLKSTGEMLPESEVNDTGMYYSDNIKKLGDKKRISPKDSWLGEHTYTLKADYMESSHAHNVGTAKFLENFFAAQLPPQQANPDNPYYNEDEDYKKVRNAIDGFPVVLIYQDLKGNNIYKGIYNFNIDKGASQVFGYKEYPDGACYSYELANNESGGAAGFNCDSSTPAGRTSIRTDFEIRFHTWEDDSLADDGFLDLDKINPETGKGYHSALTNLIDWVYSCKNDPERFKSEVSKHFDVATLIDYYILTRTLGMVDNLGKNMMISTWNADQEDIVYIDRDSNQIDWNRSTFAIWYPQFYDMDTMIGLNNTGYNVYESYHDIQGNSLDPTTYNTPDSALWVNLDRCFPTEIAARYTTLRADNRLSIESFRRAYFTDLMDDVGAYYFNRDALAKYFRFPQYYYMCQGNRKSHILRWLELRFAYMDSVYNYKASNIAFRNYKRTDQATAQINFGIKVSAPQYITVQYTDNDIETKLCSADKFTFFNKAITGSDSNITISGKPYITELTGLTYCNVEMLDLAGANNLRILDLANCRYLKNLILGDNHWLVKADLSNTVALETSLDLSSLTELVEINAKNSALIGLVLVGTKQSATNIKQMNLDNTQIAELKCSGLPNLKSIGTVDLSAYSAYSQVINLLNNYRISDQHREELLTAAKELLIENGTVSNSSLIADYTLEQIFNEYKSSLNEMYIPGLIYLRPTTKLNSIDLSSNANIDAIYISPSDSQYLVGANEFNLSYISNLTYLYLSYVVAPEINIEADSNLEYVSLNNCNVFTELDLSEAYKLESLLLPNCQELEYIYLNNAMNTLKSLSVYYCLKVKGIRYSKTATNDGFDLGKFKLTSINFSTALAIPSITNIDAVVSSLANAFYIDWRYSNDKLKILTGKIEVTGSGFTQAFWGQRGLVFNLGKGLELKVPNVTSMYRSFYTCHKLTYSDMIYIMKQVSKCTSFNYAFYNCIGIVTNSLPSDLFLCGQSAGSQSVATDISYMFGACSKMTNVVLAAGIFDPLVKVTQASYWLYDGSVNVPNYAVNNHWISEGNTSITKSSIGGTIPAGLFDKMVNLQYLDCFFAGTTITIANINTLFNKNTKIARLLNVFAGAKLTLTNAITKEFFKGLTSLTNITGLFRGSNFATAIPNEFFSYLTNLTTAPYAFCGCTSLNGLGISNFMRDNTKLSDMRFMLAGTRISGALNANLLPRDSDTDTINRDISGLFYRCEQLGSNSAASDTNDLPTNFLEGQHNLLSAAFLFGMCSNLAIRLDTTDAEGNNYYFFRDCRILNDVSGMFYRCDKLRGSLPNYGYQVELQDFYEKDLITKEYVYTPIVDKTPGFFAVFGADGNQIDSPIQYARGVFYQDRSLEGLLPDNLFSRMKILEDLAYCFYRCTGLGTLSGRELATRHLPYGLLDDCAKLKTTASMFDQARYAGRSQQEVENPTTYEELYDEVYFLPKYFFYFCPELEDVNSMFRRSWTDQSIPDDQADYYISSIYGALYENIFLNNANLSNVSNFLSYATNITGYRTTGYANAIDYNLFRNNHLLTYMSGAFYSTAIEAVEIGFILKASQVASIKSAGDFVSPGLLTRAVNGKYIGKQLIYDLETNSYLSMFDAYGIYVNQTYGF